MTGIKIKDERRARREERELRFLQKYQSKSRPHGYICYMLFIICIIYIADEVASQIGAQMQSVISQSLFAPVVGQEVALGRMAALGILNIVASAVAMLYRPLSDRFGRKLFLIINTLGMGLGLFLIGSATKIPVYQMGAMVIAFFIPHDMQAVYVMETAPQQHRAKVYSTVKAVATLGVMLVPLLRNHFMSDGNAGWRKIYLTCAVFAAVAAAIAMFMIRESDIYLTERIAYLKKSPEEKAALRAKSDGSGSQGGLVAGIRFCLTHRQLRWLFISNGFLMWGTIITMYYEQTMTNSYAAQFIESGMERAAALELATPMVTRALFMFPVGSATVQLFQGFLSDKWGRKQAALVMGGGAAVSYVLFFVGANLNLTPYIVGYLCGAAVGCYLAAGDITGSIMAAESAPTNLRSSVLTAFHICCSVFAGTGLGTGLLLLNLLGDNNVGYISMGIAIPGLCIALILLWTKTHDTKNSDLTAVTGSEWDN